MGRPIAFAGAPIGRVTDSPLQIDAILKQIKKVSP
jgi:hypothetical protein